MDIFSTIRAARTCSAPLVAVQTPDQIQYLTNLCEALGPKVPILSHDICRGFTPLTPLAEGLAAQLRGSGPVLGADPNRQPAIAFLAARDKLPANVIVCALNAHRYVREGREGDPSAIQAIGLLREAFAANRRMLQLLGPSIELPAELRNDVLLLDEPLPDEAAVRRILDKQIAAAREGRMLESVPSEEDRVGGVAALAGLSAFSVEQSVALTIAGCQRLDRDELWTRKVSVIEQTRGLTFDRWPYTFADVGGLDLIRAMGAGYFEVAPERRIRLVLRIEEMEKAIAGAGLGQGGVGDSSGVSGDQVGVILGCMEDWGWTGCLCVGGGGTGKSLFSKVLGKTYGVPSVALDLGRMKGSYVGESEANVRNAMKVLRAIADGYVFVTATCNRLQSIPPELRRRFRAGIWYFELPDRAEKDAIWQLTLPKYGLPGNAERPTDDLWTGAEIRNVCEHAQRTGKPLADCARWIVPTAKADPDALRTLRDAAAGNFLSASSAHADSDGVYHLGAGQAGGLKAVRQFLGKES